MQNGVRKFKDEMEEYLELLQTLAASRNTVSLMCLTPLRTTARATPAMFIQHRLLQQTACSLSSNNIYPQCDHFAIVLLLLNTRDCWKSSYRFTWEDVGIVPLSRSKDAAITQSHRAKWTATGKKTPTLWKTENKVEEWWWEQRKE